MKRELQAGDRVAYSANFLRSTCQHTGAVPRMRGTILALLELSKGFTLAEIKWDGVPDRSEDEGGPYRVNVGNLARVGSAAMSAN